MLELLLIDLSFNDSVYFICSFFLTFLQIAPSENFPLNLHALDELGHEITTIVFASEVDQVNSTSKILLESNMYVLSPNETVSFSFTVPETLYNEIGKNHVKKNRTIQFVDPYSTLINGYSFEMELQTCHPGFKISPNRQRCVCNTPGVHAVQR